jgi:hypothetical protein
MRTLNHFVVAFLVFALIMSLSVMIFKGFEDGYNLTPNDVTTYDFNGTHKTGSIIERFDDMLLNDGIRTATAGLNDLNSSTSPSISDLLGGLLGVGIGAVKTVAGVIIYPVQMGNIILDYYVGEIPAIIFTILASIVFVYVGFIILSRFLGVET